MKIKSHQIQLGFGGILSSLWHQLELQKLGFDGI
jgi:hypothetical protein